MMVVCSPEVDDENLPLESETGYGCGFDSFRQGGALW
ncbi:minor tail protein M [Escherichia coli FVEC1465]|nr:minor tail protein M [Escherichia coli FVEC1465]